MNTIGRNPYGWNNTIILICIVIYLIKLFTELAGLVVKTPVGYQNVVDYVLALNPLMVLKMPWQVFTSIFVHADFWHLFINMFILFFFGSELERRLGEGKYLKIFFLSGLAGSFAYLAYSLSMYPFIPAMGASAAIFGVMGALAIVAPNIRVIIFPFPFPVNIKFAILLFAFIDLILLPFSYRTGVAHVAHLAGLVVGLYLGKRYRVRFYVYY
ncbi:MAG: rhomboid family intramembrane serine protease [Archaeoglobales archaeon]|nr:MAG: rhomboid family intramembrane serine protease [Archaeoglobales archaeon]